MALPYNEVLALAQDRILDTTSYMRPVEAGQFALFLAQIPLINAVDTLSLDDFLNERDADVQARHMEELGVEGIALGETAFGTYDGVFEAVTLITDPITVQEEIANGTSRSIGHGLVSDEIYEGKIGVKQSQSYGVFPDALSSWAVKLQDQTRPLVLMSTAYELDENYFGALVRFTKATPMARFSLESTIDRLPHTTDFDQQ